MAIPAGITIGWPSTAASIPTGWDRVTTLDDRFGKGTAAGVDPDVTGGAATHTHVSPSHSHTVGSHSHTGTTGVPDTLEEGGNDSFDVASDTHTHTYTSGAVAASAASAAVWQTGSSDPSFFRMIWIESDGTPDELPDGSVAFYDAAAPPAGWIQHVASKDRFLIGAAPAGDGGGTGGGGSHAHTPDAHSHTIVDHTHGTVVSSGGTGTEFRELVGGAANPSPIGHTHPTVTLAVGPNEASGSQTSANSGGTSYEPAFYTLLAIENDTGGDDLPIDTIAGWRGLLSTIPSGWVICDGTLSTPDLRDKFIKCANIGADVGTTAGSAGHDHSDPATHTHTVGHTHDATTDAASTGGTDGQSIPNITALREHSHSAAVASDSAGGVSGGTAQTVNTTADTQPPFRTVVWIQVQVVLVVIIDDPNEDDVETTPAFLIDWSFGAAEVQQDFRVQIFSDAGATAEVYDSGTVITATTQEEVTRPLLTGNTYWIRVTCTDTDSTVGISALRRITTSWIPPIEITGLTVAEVEEPD